MKKKVTRNLCYAGNSLYGVHSRNHVVRITDISYSSTRRIRVTALVLRFVNNLKLRVESRVPFNYQQEEFPWIKSLQNLEERSPISNGNLCTLDCLKTRMEFNDAREDLEMLCCHLMQGFQYFYHQTTV